MAHVQITLLEGRTMEQKRRAVKRITEALHEELDASSLRKLTILRFSQDFPVNSYRSQ